MLTRGGAGIGPFAPMVNSLRRITPAEAAAIRPRVIDVVTVRPGDTVQSLAEPDGLSRLPARAVPVAQRACAEARLVPGQKVKLVVYGARRA